MLSESIDAKSSDMPPIELTLIVAATRSMGIGHSGTLPWTGLRREIAYFARITKRVDATLSNSAHANSQPLRNAVIMGRKTWDSIPERFRPLKGRLNVVLSRSCPSEPRDGNSSEDKPVRFPSLASAVEGLSGCKDIGKLFVIGGAEVYRAALAEKEAKRILLTRVLTDFECDTFFPVKLDENEDGEWKKKSKQELDHWVGEEVLDGVQEENGIKYVFEMYERN